MDPCHRLDELHRFSVFESEAQALFARVATRAEQLFGARAVLVAIGPEDRPLVRVLEGGRSRVLAGELKLLGRVARSGTPATGEALGRGADLVEGAWAAVPLSAACGPLGVLAVVTAGRWTARDVLLLEVQAAWLVDVLERDIEIHRRRRSETHVASQKEVLERIARGAPLEEVFQALAHHVEQQVPGSLCLVRLARGDGGVDLVAGAGLPEILGDLMRDPANMGPGPEAAVWGRDDLVVIPETEAPPPHHAGFASGLRAHDLRAYWGVPVRSDAAVDAVLDVYRSAPGVPDPEATRVLDTATAIAGIALDRRRAEEALRRSEVYFRSLIENSAELTLVLGADASVRYASPSARRALILDDEASTPDCWIHESDVARVTGVLAGLGDRGTSLFDLRSPTRLGGRRFSAVASNLLSNPAVGGIVVNARDVTERYAAEAALRRSEERYRLVSRSTNDIVWDWDTTTERVVWSEAMERVLGYAFTETDYAWWRERVHAEDRDEVVAGLGSALDGTTETWSAEYRFLRADGQYAMIHDRGLIARDGEGKARRVIGSMADVTRRRELEEQLRQSQRMEAVGRLAGGVAHDFNNLLTAMTGFVELLRERLEGEDEEKLAFLAEISRAASRASALTRQLLAFSRRQVLQPREVDPGAVIRGLEPMLRRLISENVAIETDLDPGVPSVWADLGQLEQVIVNLAVNARDAMPDGGRLHIATSVVRVAADEPGMSELTAGRYVRIMVADSGHGIAPELLPKIFEPFFTTKQASGGTGLGLSTVYGIVRQSDGQILVSSEVGKGTRFSVYLPAGESGHAPATPSAGELVRSSGSGVVLLVEDHDAVRDLARRVLERNGYTVAAAPDGESALARLEEGALVPDVLLTDVVLPGLSGPETAERVRAAIPGVHVVFMSGYADDHLGPHGTIDEDVAFLQKPFTPRALADIVAAARGGARPSAVAGSGSAGEAS